MLVPHPTANLDEQQPRLDIEEEKEEDDAEEDGEEHEGDDEQQEQLSPEEAARLRVQIQNSLTEAAKNMINAPNAEELETMMANFKRGEKLLGFCTHFELATLLRFIRQHTKGTPWRIPGQVEKVTMTEHAALDRLEKMYLALNQEDEQPCGHLFLCTPRLTTVASEGSSVNLPYEFLDAAGVRDWRAVAMSQNGQVLVAANKKGYLWIKDGKHIDEGWMDGSGGEGWRSLAVGNDNSSILVAALSGGKVLISTSRGEWGGPRKWIQLSSLEPLKWVGVAARKGGFVLVEEEGGVYQCTRDSAGIWKLHTQPLCQLALEDKQKVKTFSACAVKEGGLFLATLTNVPHALLPAGVPVSSDGGDVWVRQRYCLPPLQTFPPDWRARWEGHPYKTIKPGASALSSGRTGTFGVVACFSGHICSSCDPAKQWDLLLPPQDVPSNEGGWAGVEFVRGKPDDETPCILLLQHDGGVWLSSPVPLQIENVPVALDWENVLDGVPHAPWVACASASDASVVLLATRSTAALRHIVGFRAGLTHALFTQEKREGKTREGERGELEIMVEAAKASKLSEV